MAKKDFLTPLSALCPHRQLTLLGRCSTSGRRPAHNDRSTPSLPPLSCRRASVTLAAWRRQMADLAATRHLYHPSASQYLRLSLATFFFPLRDRVQPLTSRPRKSLLTTGFSSATATIDTVCQAMRPTNGGQLAKVAFLFARRPLVPRSVSS